MIDLGTLNPQQRQAVETVRGPVLILAGAGTGKTRVITYRIAHLVAQGVSPGQILAVTFTNKAAREMQERVRRLLPGAGGGARPGGADRPTVCTFHSLCVRILRRYAGRLGYKPNFVIYDEAEQLSVIKKLLSRVHGAGTKVDAAEVLALLSRWRNRADARAGEADTPVAVMAGHLQSRYEAALRACNAMDFDDLILLVLRLLEGDAEVLEECRRRYRYVMVDEYQDTNAAQFRLVHALTREHRNLCVVGDDDQSIYGWRGAEVANILDLEQHYPEVKVVRLEQNYRSTTTILEAANAVIRHNARRRGKRLWSQNGAGRRIVVNAFDDEEAEARAVVDAIEFGRQIEQVPWSDQAVLFRTNGQSRPLETAFRQAGIRYHLVGGQSFFDRREIRDFLAYLKTMVNPEDDISLLRIANVPARGLSEATMERLLGASHDRKCPVFAVMREPHLDPPLMSRTRESLAAWVNLVIELRAQLEAGPGFRLRIWAENLLRATGYLEDLRRSEKDPEAAENRVRNLMDLVATMDGMEPAASPAEQLQRFLEDLTLDREGDDAEDEVGNAVTLITMHSCKGLEYPQVHVVGIEEGLLPHARSTEEGTLEEERRLFYVAITRAKRTLTLSHCGRRRKYGQHQPCHPSRFLKELPPELVEDGQSRKPVTPEGGKRMFDGLRAMLDAG